MNPRLRTPAIIVSLALLAAVAYARSIEVPFFWDDKPLILYNPYLGRVSGIVAFFSPNFWKGSLYPEDYRPIDMFSYRWDYLFWARNPAGYHITNVLLHIFNCVAVYFLVRMLFNREALALLAGFLYSLHPIHSEAVIWIQNRSDLLVTSFSLITLIALVRREKEKLWRGLASVIYLSFVSALLTKENAIVLPLLMIVVLIHFRSVPRKSTLIIVGSCAAIAVGFLLVKIFALHQWRHGDAQLPLTGGGRFSIFVIVKSIATYCSMLIFPFSFSLDRCFTIPASHPVLALAVSGIALIALAFVAARELLLGRPAGFALSFIFVSLIPASNIVLLAGRPIAEQRLYFPSVGFCLLAALLFQSIGEGARRRALIALCIVPLLSCYLLITVKRTDCWLSEQVLWERTLEVSPTSWRSKLFLAALYGQQGRHAEAVGLLKQVLRTCFPRPANAFKELGIVYQKRHWNDSAIDAFRKALRCSPDHLESRLYLGDALKEIGEYDAAREHYSYVARTWPLIGEGQLRLGILYKEQARYDDARKEFEKLLELYPDNEKALTNIASIYGHEGRDREAEELFTRLIAANPRSVLAHNDYGLHLERRGRYGEAIEHYRIAIRNDPDAALPHYNLAQAYLRTGEKGRALLELLTAARLQPDRDDILYEINRLRHIPQESPMPDALSEDIIRAYGEALNHRGIYWAQAGDTAAARDCFQKLIALQPDNGHAHANLGRNYAEEGNFTRALEELLVAVKHLPSEASVYSNLGICYAALGRMSDARKAWEKALALDPQAKEPRRNLARMRGGTQMTNDK